MPRCEFWTAARPAEMAACYAAEEARWQQTLDWDTAATWPALEQARVTGALPGFVLRDPDGALCGGTYAAERDGELHRGALAASDADGTAGLVDAVRTLPTASRAPRLVCFAFTAAPGVDEALTASGFRLNRTRPRRRPGRLWDVRDVDATADLLGTSYPADLMRPFAPHGHPAEWRRYVADLVLGHGCGRFKPSLSLAVPGAGGTLDAAALVTHLGCGTAHLAQLAVRPGLRGGGLGSDLLDTVSATAAAAGFVRLTLLVGGENVAARRLYDRAGFESRARFVSATRLSAAGAAGRRFPAA